MPVGVLAKLSWSVGQKMHAGVASELGVSRATVTRYLTGIREIPEFRLSQIERMYERTQYEIMRTRGLSPEASTRYRGLIPNSFDGWVDRLETLKEKWAEGHLAARLRREDLDLDDLTADQLQAMYDEEYDRLTDDIDQSNDDIEELEGSP